MLGLIEFYFIQSWRYGRSSLFFRLTISILQMLIPLKKEMGIYHVLHSKRICSSHLQCNDACCSHLYSSFITFFGNANGRELENG